jgi:cyclohexadienyl dehydratase
MKFGKVIRYFHIVLVIALLGSLVGVDVAWGSMLDKIIGRGHILVGTAGDYKPFTYLNPSANQFEGIDIDMALHLGKSLGVEVRFVKTSWPTLMKDFLEGKYDIGMGGVSINLERQKKAFFTISYLKDGKTPITRRENVAKFSTLDQIDQPGVKVIVNPGGTNERFVRASIKKATIIVYEDNVTILTKSFKAKPTS